MLSVLFVTPYYAPAWEYGGIPRATYDLAQALVSAGAEVFVVTTDAHTRYQRVQALDKWVVEDDVKVFRIANLSNRLVYRAGLPVPIGGMAALHSALPSVDIIHLHGHRHLLNHIVVDILYRRKIPYVFSGHGSVPAIESKVTLKRIYDSLVGRRILDGARLYIAVSNIEVLQLRAAGMKEPKIRKIYNPVPAPPEGLLSRRGFFRADWLISQESPMVLFLGKITPRKGVDILLRAFAKMRTPRARLVISGGALGQGLLPYKKMGESLGISERVIFTDHLAPSERFHALLDADVLAYPSRDEIFGLAAAEALLVGTPVVASNDSGLAEILRLTGGARLVPYGDAEALAQSLDELLRDVSSLELATEIVSAREWILANLNPATVAEQMLASYRDVLSQG
ncbi:MAG: glycosyltransferase [Myxococcota bacterium]